MANDYTLSVKVTADSSDLQRNLQAAQDELKKTADGVRSAGDESTKSGDKADRSTKGWSVLKGALSNLVSDGITRAMNSLKDLAGSVMTTGIGFDSEMSNVKAISGATESEFEALRKKALEMGSSTKFTASEASEALSYMAMAGWDSGQMISGLDGVLNLAAAAGADLATTSDIVTDALTAMGYGAEESGHLADVMAAASSNANTNVELMGSTFKYAAPIVGALGYSMEDTAVAIGIMANAGIKGEQAGTSLRAILTRLSAPPKECAEAMEALGISLTETGEDGQEHMKDLDTVIHDLRKAFSGLSEEQKTQRAKQIAGTNAMSGFLAIVNGADADLDKLTDAVRNSDGAAADMAATMEDNLGGSITKFKSKVEGIKIKIFDQVKDKAKNAIQTISDALDRVNWNAVAQKIGEAAEHIADALAWILDHGEAILGILKSIAVAFVTYKAVSIITGVVSTIQTLHTAISGANTIMELLNGTIAANPIALVAAAVAALVAGFIELEKAHDNMITAPYKLSEEEQALIDKINERAEAYKAARDARDEAMGGIQAEYDHIRELKDEYNNLLDANGDVMQGEEDRAEFILTQLCDALGIERDQIDQIKDANGRLGDSIDDLILKQQAQAVLAANEQAYAEAVKGKTDALTDWEKKVEEADEREKKYNETQEALRLAQEQLNEVHGMSAQAAMPYMRALADAQKANDAAKESYEASAGAVQEAADTYVGYMTDIQNYEGLGAAILSGDSDKIKEAMDRQVNHFITAETGSKESLERQVQNCKDTYEAMKKASEDGSIPVTAAMLQGAQDAVDAAQRELDRFPTVVGNAMADAKSEADSVDFSDSGENIVNGLIVGVDRATDRANNHIRALAAGLHQTFNRELRIQSPSKVMRESGGYFAEGAILGIQDWFRKAAAAGAELASVMYGGYQDLTPDSITSGTRESTRTGDSYDNSRNYGPMTVNVYGAAGQNEETLADAVMERIRFSLNREALA